MTQPSRVGCQADSPRAESERVSRPFRPAGDREVARAAIGDCARTILREQGAAGLSTRAVADRLGIAPGTIYNYFESMDELRQELADRFFWSLNEAIDEQVGDAPGVEALRRILLTCLRAARENPEEFRVSTSLWTGGQWEPRSEAADVFFSRINQALRQVHQIPPADPRFATLACGVAALLQGIPLVAAGPAGWSAADDAAVAPAVLDALVRGTAVPD